jgi:hypothetical protein
LPHLPATRSFTCRRNESTGVGPQLKYVGASRAFVAAQVEDRITKNGGMGSVAESVLAREAGGIV